MERHRIVKVKTRPIRSSAVLVGSDRPLTEPKLSPDGLTVVFSTATASGTALVGIALPEGPELGGFGPETLLTVDPPVAGAHPSGGGSYDWLPDSSGLIYVAKTGGLYEIDRGGSLGRLVVAAPEGARLWSPTVSPDGRFIAFVIDDEATQSIGVAQRRSDAPGEILVVFGYTVGPLAANFRCDPAWSSQSGLPVGKEPTDGTRSEAEMGPDSSVQGPDGLLTWHEWSDPNMPWDESRIVCTRITAGVDGTLPIVVGPIEVVAGSTQLSTSQPRFSSTGALGWLDDRSGFRNVRIRSSVVLGSAVHTPVDEPFEHGGPTWGPGNRSWCWSPSGEQVAFVRNEGGFAKLCIADVSPENSDNVNATQTSVVRELARAVHIGVSWATTPGGSSRIAAVRTGGKTPAQLVVYDVASGSKTTFARGSVGAWDGFTIPEPEVISWTATDGTTVHGRIYRPTETTGPTPMIVSAHGGPTDQNMVTFNPRFVHWLGQGWSILVPDYRGSTGWGREYATAMRGRWGDIDVTDCADGVRHAITQGWADPARIVMMGGSAGGLTTLHLLARFGELFAGGIVLYPVTDLDALDATTHRYEKYYNASLVGTRTDALYAERSPITHVSLIKAPLLILHGDADPVVGADQSRAVAEQLTALGRDVELVIYEGEGHGWRKPETRIDEISRIDTFLARFT
jgi:dipeptidyl aminopeptidase/acylaminoacyl peptidase